MAEADLPRHAGRLLWSLRHYAWVIVACMLALAAIPLLITDRSTTYQAQSLVVAQQLSVNQKVLPRLAERIFANGQVARRVAEDPAVDVPANELIPAQLDVVAAEDSVALVVHARDSDPESAARLADLAAAAFADELNRGGAGVGLFDVQSEALIPTKPLPTLSPLVKGGIGAAAGLVLGLGLVALIAAVRRPVISGQDVTAVLGVPLLGTVWLPPDKHGPFPGPVGVRGIATVVRRIASLPASRLLLISPPAATSIRQRVYVMTAVAASTVRHLRLQAPAELVTAVGEHLAALRSTGRQVQPVRDARPLELVDGGSPLDLLDPAKTAIAVVAVVPRGTPRRRLRAVGEDFVDAGLAGVVLTEARHKLWAARRGSAAPRGGVARRPAAQPSVAAVPEPEPA